MSIEIIKCITTDEYKEVFPTTAQDTDRIERAINYSFLIIDGVTSGAITKRWNLESTEEGYLTDEQKDLVKKAFVIETNYALQQNLDLAAQQKSFSFGGVSFSSNKSPTNQLCESARNYLKEAGLFYKTEFVGPTSSSYSSLLSDLTEYVTYTVGDKRYLLTTDTNSTHWNKFIKYNSSGAAEFVSVSAIVGDNYYTKDECDSTFATIVALLAEAKTRSDKDDELEQYCDNLDSTKAADDSVVHNTKNETISGIKTFNSSPIVPTPTTANQAVNVTYVSNKLQDYYTKDETYSATEIDQKIATGTGLYLGWLQNDDNELPSESEIGTWIVNNWSKLQPSAVEQVTNNDYVFIYFSTQYVYWRVKVVTDAPGKVLPSAVSWKKDLEFDDDIVGLVQQVETNTNNIATLDSSKVSKSGDTMTGTLTVLGGVVAIASTGDTAIVNASQSSNSYIEFKSGTATLGYIGVNSSKKPVFYDTEDKQLATTDDIPHLYRHEVNVSLVTSNFSANIVILSNSETSYGYFDSVYNYLSDNGFYFASGVKYSAHGWYKTSSDASFIITNCAYGSESSSDVIKFYYGNTSGTSSTIDISKTSSGLMVQDTVTQIF